MLILKIITYKQYGPTLANWSNHAALRFTAQSQHETIGPPIFSNRHA